MNANKTAIRTIKQQVLLASALGLLVGNLYCEQTNIVIPSRRPSPVTPPPILKADSHSVPSPGLPPAPLPLTTNYQSHPDRLATHANFIGLPSSNTFSGPATLTTDQSAADHRTNALLWEKCRAAQLSKDSGKIAQAERELAAYLATKLGRIEGKNYPTNMSLQAVMKEYQKYERH